VEVAPHDRAVRALDALLELLDGQAPGGGVLAEALGGRGALAVAHAHAVDRWSGHAGKIRHRIVRRQLLRYAADMPPPSIPPIGLRLTKTARAVSQAFERAMAEAGGSAATWQVLLLVQTQNWGTQSAMAEAMGITAATLTHHLNALERQGLVRRWREPGN